LQKAGQAGKLICFSVWQILCWEMLRMKFGVVVFPGSNCDHDAYHVISKVIGQPVDFVWHRSTNLGECDAVILPGGFSYGDYLRCGAIASFSPVMKSIKEFAARGGFVLGICNGFQVLCESGLLPGSLLRNEGLQFICDYVNIRVESTNTPYTSLCKDAQVLNVPIAHAEGNYFCDDATLDMLEAEDRIVFRYCNEVGDITRESNPNGARSNIAGICNRERNVLGLMPHPERASEEILGSADGRVVFNSLAATIAELVKA
jgi:phosphoribosylformylglycinamidine synthase